MLANLAVALVGALVPLASAAPAGDNAIQARAAACTFTTLDQVLKGKKSCDEINLNGISVPAGKTLDLTGLKKGAKVRYQRNPTLE